MNGNNTVRNVGTITMILFALSGVLWGFAAGSARIGQNAIAIGKLTEQVGTVNKKATTNRETLIELKTSMEFFLKTQIETKDDMKKGFDRLEKAIKNER